MKMLSKWRIALICMFTDIIMGLWTYDKISTFTKFKSYFFPTLKKYLGASVHQSSSSELNEMLEPIYAMFKNALLITLTTVFLFHLFVYLSYALSNKAGKAGAKKYLKFYTFTAGILTLLTYYGSNKNFIDTSLLLGGFFYLFAWLGIRKKE